MSVSELLKSLKSINVMSAGTLLALVSWMCFFTYVGTIEYHNLKSAAEYAKNKALLNEQKIFELKDSINVKFDQLRREIRAGENRLGDKIDNIRN